MILNDFLTIFKK